MDDDASDGPSSGDEAARVFAWRYEQLRQAGYPVEEAEEIADSPSVELHAACELLASGCPPDLAARILL